jgi:hypothetical protein
VESGKWKAESEGRKTENKKIREGEETYGLLLDAQQDGLLLILHALELHDPPPVDVVHSLVQKHPWLLKIVTFTESMP